MIYKTLTRTPILLAVVASVFGAANGAAAQQLTETDCSTLRGQAATTCLEALKSGAASSVFVRLGELLLDDRNFFLAVKVYRRGVRLHPGNTELEAKLTVAESGLDEAQWIELRRQEAAEQAGTTIKAEIFKCTRLAQSAPQTALQACDAALKVTPGDPKLLEAKGDALRTIGQDAEAYLAYDAAAGQAPSPALKEKLTALAQYKPKPAPAPVVKAEPEPVKTEPAAQPVEEKPVQTAAAVQSEAAQAEKQKEEAGAAERSASLREVVNDRSRGLAERLEARNTLMSMARQDGG